MTAGGPRALRVLAIAPTPYFSDRGCHIRIWNELMALRARGHAVSLYTYPLGRDEGDAEIVRTPRIPGYRKTEAGPSWHKLTLDPLLLLRLLGRTRRGQFDVIHAHLHEGAWIGLWLRPWLAAPLVLDAQGSLLGELSEHGLPTALRGAVRTLERFIVARADHVLASSQGLLDFLAEDSPEARGRLTLLEDAVPTSALDPVPEQRCAALRRRLGLPAGGVVAYTGGLVPGKGLELLIEAMPFVLERHPHATLLVAGYGQTERYRALARALEVAERVRFAGRVDYFEIGDHLALADVAVDPKPASSTESSAKLLHYLAAGLPVVAIEGPSARALVGAAGLLAEGSPAALAAAISRALGDPALRAELASAGRSRVAERHLWRDRIEDVISVYEGLLRDRAAR